MKEFIRKYEERIHGVLSCFDRVLFRGHLPITSGWKMALWLYRLNVNFGSLKPFLLENSERVKNHAVAMAQKQGRPFQYLKSNIDKEEAARKLAPRDGIRKAFEREFASVKFCEELFASCAAGTWSHRAGLGRVMKASAMITRLYSAARGRVIWIRKHGRFSGGQG